MKTSVVISWIDIPGQVAMLFPFIIPIESGSWDPALQAYFSVGGWQVLSLILHSLADPERRARRASYARVISIIAITAGVALICAAPLLFDFSGSSTAFQQLAQFGGGLLVTLMAVLLVAGPILAVWYFWICVRELRQHHSAVTHRREIHWKL